jgi:hypothetical protein
MIGKRDGTCRRAAAGVEFRERDLGCRYREIGESCKLRARRRGIRWALGEGSVCANNDHGNGRRGRPEQRVPEQ